jgi:hypothetical protein
VSESNPPPKDAEFGSLAERLARYAASPVVQDWPPMQRDLLSASEQVADYQDLINAWAAAFAHPDIGQGFAQMLGTGGMDVACRRRLRRSKSSFQRARMPLGGCAVQADGLRHDRDAENEGLKIAYLAVAPVWPGAQPHDSSRPALPEPAPQPHLELEHPKAAFYRPGPPPCFSGAALDGSALPATASAGRYL